MPNNWKWSSKVLEQVLAWRCKLELVEDINSNKAKSNLVMMCECAVSINFGRSSNETGNQGWLHWPKNKQWFLLGSILSLYVPFYSVKWSKVGSSPTQQCLLTANVCQKFSKFFPNLTLPSLSTYPQDKTMTNQIEVILSTTLHGKMTYCTCLWRVKLTTNGLISCRKKIKFCIRAGCTAASSAFGQVHVIGSYFRT